MSHLLRHQSTVAIEITTHEPVPQCRLGGFVLLRQHEVDKVGKRHPSWAEPTLTTIGERALSHLKDSERDVGKNNQQSIVINSVRNKQSIRQWGKYKLKIKLKKQHITGRT